MKKSLIKLLSVLLIFIFIFSLCGCYNENKNDLVLSKKVQNKIKSDYFLQFNEELTILKYYGTYNENIVIKAERGTWPVVTPTEIDGVLFEFSDTNLPLIWHDGCFYEFIAGYDEGFLSKGDLNIIAAIVNGLEVLIKFD